MFCFDMLLVYISLYYYSYSYTPHNFFVLPLWVIRNFLERIGSPTTNNQNIQLDKSLIYDEIMMLVFAKFQKMLVFGLENSLNLLKNCYFSIRCCPLPVFNSYLCIPYGRWWYSC